jgi:hypothetical protein
MIVLLASGGLGNQIFEYAAVRTVAGRERLLLVGFDDLLMTLEGVEASAMESSGSLAYRILNRYRTALDSFLAKSRLLGRISEEFELGRPSVKLETGLLRSLSFCLSGFFQAENLMSEAILSRLQIRSALVDKANALVNREDLAGRTPIFVHVRRGDYLAWPSKRAPAVIPDHWYRRCIAEMSQRYTKPSFIFVTNDVAYVRENFGDVAHSYISAADSLSDFALMSVCHAGILSASSFSWWGSYFARRKNSVGCFLAPLYWAGHAQENWFPEGVSTSFLEYRSVGSSSG